MLGDERKMLDSGIWKKGDVFCRDVFWNRWVKCIIERG